MYARATVAAVVACLLGAIAFVRPAQSEEPRPEWDQKRAVERVKRIIALEQSGKPWDEIPWQTDVAKAVGQAEKEGKPLFVYWYVEKGGPTTAPC